MNRGKSTAIALALLALAPAPATAGDVESVCAGVPKEAQAGYNQQKVSYCNAARAAEKSVGTNGVLWKIWAGVAAVCMPACVAEKSSPYLMWMRQACTAANLGGSATDAVMTKSFVSSLAGLGMSGYSAYKDYKDFKAGKAEERDALESCMPAGAAALQSVMKYMAQKDHQSTVDSNLEKARALDSLAAGVGAPQVNNSGGGLAGGTTPNQGTPTAPGTGPQTASTSGDPCSRAGSTGSYGDSIQCAAATGSLPPIVGDPKFNEAFKDVTGKDFSDFLKSNDSPRGTLGSAMGASLSTPEQGQKLASAITAAENAYQNTGGGTSAVYATAGGGGRRSVASDEGGLDMAGMMSNLMNQFMPKDGEQAPPGYSTVEFQSLTRAPAQVIEDKTLSLFNRVSFRYYYVGRNFTQGRQ